jgi:very-short-patch-repair endonuclease
MASPKTLTPALSREREREKESSLSGEPEREKESPLSREPERAKESSLSRLRERARVRARALRSTQTDAEALVWSRLRNRQMLGLKFRRQHPIGPYFGDFVCIEAGLVLELDGGQHMETLTADHDKRREQLMAEMGFKTLRFWDNEVLKEIDGVLEVIRTTVLALTPTLSRERERE